MRPVKAGRPGGQEVPELPELEMVRRSLEARCLGKTIASAVVNQPACVNLPPPVYERVIVGGTIGYAWRKGKLVILDLSNGVSLVIHLALGGEVLLKDSSDHDPKATQIVLAFTDGTALHFHQLRLGNVHACPTYHLAATRVGKLGADALNELPTAERLQTLYGAARTGIKQLLLDQSLLCGIGNFHADEILFRAGIHPQAPGKSLAADQFTRLREAIRQVLEEALRSKEPGAGEFEAQVYGRAGEACRACGSAIERLRIANRSAYCCPKCQPAQGAPRRPERVRREPSRTRGHHREVAP